MNDEPVRCTRCACPECERERAELWDVIWLLVELPVFEAQHARGYNTKVEKLQRVWELHRLKAHINAKIPGG